MAANPGVPLDALVRPRIQYQASCAILCRAGKDLGCTMTGHHDFQLADDIIHKVHIGHYTFYSIAVVKNDKLFIKARGVFSRKYLGGEGNDPVITKGNYVDNPTADTLFSDISDADDQRSGLLVGGTYVAREGSYINPLGFGPYTYQGCKAGREGKGMPLRREKTVADIKRKRGEILDRRA